MVILVEIGSWYFRLPSLQFVDESLMIGNHFVNELLLGMKNINLQQKLSKPLAMVTMCSKKESRLRII